ncbi:hypothetical protein CRUP_018820 [Coryphaenoides rupestris]|nr:hypothetical protein CRUP_018820 [Coryphaenoides rupestris]
MEDEWEEEEQVVVVELSGVINNDFLSKCSEDTKENTTDLKYNCHTVKRLKMQRIFLTEKKDEETGTGLGQEAVADCVGEQDTLDSSHEGKSGEQQDNSAADPTVE